MKRNRAAARILKLMVIFVFCSGLRGEEISFLQVRFGGGVLEVLDHSMREGRFTPEAQRGVIGYEVLDERNEVVFSGRMVEPNSWEVIGSGAVVLEDVPLEFCLRIPSSVNGKARRLRLFRNDELLGTTEIPAPSEPLRALVASGSKRYTLLTNGPTGNRINFVFLAEGFRAEEETKFTNQAVSVLKRFLGTAPYDIYSNYFNAFAIFVPSNESGADRPSQGVFRDTYFSSSFESYGIDYLLTIPPNTFDSNYANGRGRVTDLLMQHLPEYHIVVMLVNDTKYGGSGGFPAIASLNDGSSEIALHEVGHSFAALGDEYSTPASYPDLEEPNTTRETRREFIKWNAWIASTTPVPTPATAPYSSVIGLFEGAHYHGTGWYRPKFDCRMRNLGVPFCDVCREALVLSFYSRVNMIETKEPVAPNVTSSAAQPSRLAFTSLPVGTNVSFSWIVDDHTIFPAVSAFDFDTFYTASGLHTVKLVARDSTTLVRMDPGRQLSETNLWRVTVSSSPTPVVTLDIGGDGGDKFNLRVTSTLTATLVLEGSSNLTEWSGLGTNAFSSRLDFTDTSGLHRFFRARAQPAF